MVEIIVRCVANIIGESCDEQGAIKMIGGGNRNRRVIEKRSLASLGGEKFVSSGIKDDADEAATFVLDPDRDTVGRKSVGEVGGAVKRINDPLIWGW